MPADYLELHRSEDVMRPKLTDRFIRYAVRRLEGGRDTRMVAEARGGLSGCRPGSWGWSTGMTAGFTGRQVGRQKLPAEFLLPWEVKGARCAQ